MDQEKHKPFLKYAGGKFKLVDELKKYFPENASRYIEPFLGSGAVFFNVEYDKYILNDNNQDLMSIFRNLRKHGEGFLDYVESFFYDGNNDENIFYDFRKEFNKTDDKLKKSALFIYLNRHCYNGLCRYNGKNEFNVPFGKYNTIYFPRKEMEFCIEKIKKCSLFGMDFRRIFQKVKRNDVVYCDPPYIPLSDTAYFTDYSNNNGFSLKDHEELAQCAQLAAKKGATVIVSNHFTPGTEELYKDAEIYSIDVQRNISRDGENREKIKEIIAVYRKAKG